jgi:glycosyltransferase involved in cell wall biosynthesis
MFDYKEAREQFRKGNWEHQGIGQEELDRYFEQVDAPFSSDDDRVEIIVMKYKRPDIEVECAAEVIKNTSHPYKLTFFDNRNNGPNTSRAWNKLIREATCEMVVVMDSDVFVTEGWLEPLVNAIRKEDCALAVPVTGNSAAAAVQQKPKSDEEDHPVEGHVSGCCFITTKTIIEKLGWFDENFLVFGQDSEICDRIHISNKQIRLCPRSLIYHGKRLHNFKADMPRDWDFSMSTKKAADEGEFSWSIDTQFAPYLTNKKRIYYQDNNVKFDL